MFRIYVRAHIHEIRSTALSQKGSAGSLGAGKVFRDTLSTLEATAYEKHALGDSLYLLHAHIV